MRDGAWEACECAMPYEFIDQFDDVIDRGWELYVGVELLEKIC